MQKQAGEHGIWGRVTLGAIAVLAVDLILMIIFILLGRTVWELPYFYLGTAVILLLASILYLLIRRWEFIPVWQKRLLIGLTGIGFLVLILTSGLATIAVLMSI